MRDDVLRGIDAPRPLPAHVRSALEERLLGDELVDALRTAESPRVLSPDARDVLERQLVRRRRVPVWLVGAAAAAVLVGALAALPSSFPGPLRVDPVPVPPVALPGVEAPAPVPSVAPVAPSGAGAPAVLVPEATPQPSPQPPASAAAGVGEGAAAGGSPGEPAAWGPGRGVTAVSPDEGPLAGGTRVTLSGNDLSRTVRVLFADRVGESLVVESDTRISVLTPAQPEPVRAPIEVHLSTGEVYLVDAGFTYLAAPAVTALDPAEGSPAGGNVVVVRGRGFTERSGASFGDTRAREVQVVSETELRVVAPAHLPGPVEVTVTTAGGTSAGARYVYRP